FGPDPRARLPREEPHALAAVTEREHEEARPAVLPRLRMADHRAVAVVDLALLAGRRLDDGVGIGDGGTPELAYEAHDTRVAGGKAVAVDEVLPDGHRVAPARQGRRDQLAVGLAPARHRAVPGGRGGHPVLRW